VQLALLVMPALSPFQLRQVPQLHQPLQTWMHAQWRALWVVQLWQVWLQPSPSQPTAASASPTANAARLKA
jgi:hypothetical protein